MRQSYKLICFTSEAAQAWLDLALRTPYPSHLRGSIPILEVSGQFLQGLGELSISTSATHFGLDLSCSRHIWHEHGGIADKRRDQIPISQGDLVKWQEFTKGAKLKRASENPRTKGKTRVIAQNKISSLKHDIILEVRKHLIVPVTMWKREAGR